METPEFKNPSAFGLPGESSEYKGGKNSYKEALAFLESICITCHRLNEKSGEVSKKISESKGKFFSNILGKTDRLEELRKSQRNEFEKEISKLNLFKIRTWTEGKNEYGEPVYVFDTKLLENVLGFLRSNSDVEEWFYQGLSDHWIKLRGEELEHEFCRLLHRKGIKSRRSGGTFDGGVDVSFAHNDQSYIVQCKGWAKPVGVSTIRELHGVINSRKEKRLVGIVVAPNGFTGPASALAQHVGILTISNNKLLRISSSENIDDFLLR